MKSLRWMIGEFLGTFVLVFIGCGIVCVAVLTGARVGPFQVAIVWGLGIAVAMCMAGTLSGAHLNPSVTLSLAVWRGFPMRRMWLYIASQVAGAFAGAALLFVLFSGVIHQYENRHGIVRGQPGSEASAMVFGEYFPNPRGRPLSDKARTQVSHLAAVGVEIVGTAILMLVIFGLTDDHNKPRSQVLTAAAIGLTVTLLISLLAPLTMACFNPARDFGPRMLSSLAGWGAVPFQANGVGWLTVYIAAPLMGGLLGGGLYSLVLKPACNQRHAEKRTVD